MITSGLGPLVMISKTPCVTSFTVSKSSSNSVISSLSARASSTRLRRKAKAKTPSPAAPVFRICALGVSTMKRPRLAISPPKNAKRPLTARKQAEASIAPGS